MKRWISLSWWKCSKILIVKFRWEYDWHTFHIFWRFRKSCKKWQEHHVYSTSFSLSWQSRASGPQLGLLLSVFLLPIKFYFCSPVFCFWGLSFSISLCSVGHVNALDGLFSFVKLRAALFWLPTFLSSADLICVSLSSDFSQSCPAWMLSAFPAHRHCQRGQVEGRRRYALLA